MATQIQSDMFTPDVIADPYTYYGRLRDEDRRRQHDQLHERDEKCDQTAREHEAHCTSQPPGTSRRLGNF